jgi:hypothetical protein
MTIFICLIAEVTWPRVKIKSSPSLEEVLHTADVFVPPEYLFITVSYPGEVLGSYGGEYDFSGSLRRVVW